jgi:hypothetical protein
MPDDGGARRDINVRIQKATRLFSKLRKVWLSTSIRKDTKIRIMNACVKHVLLYGCETWLGKSEIRRKIQTFFKSMSETHLKNVVTRNYNKDGWKATGQEDVNLEMRKRKFGWTGHTLRKDDGEIRKPPYNRTLKETGKEEVQKTVGEDRLTIRRGVAGMN